VDNTGFDNKHTLTLSDVIAIINLMITIYRTFLK